MIKNSLSEKGFIVPVLLGVIALLVIGGGVYFYTNKKVEAPLVVSDNKVDEENKEGEDQKVENLTPNTSTTTQVKNTKSFKLGTLEFSYPSILTVSKNGEYTVLEHSFPWTHENRCAFAAEDKPNLDRIEDFDLSFSLINKNIDDTMKSHTPPYDPDKDIVKYQIGSLKGYKVHYNFEACGADQYYFQVSDKETLFVARPFHVQSAPQQRLSELNSISGFIAKEKEEQIFKDILSSVKGLDQKETMSVKVYFINRIYNPEMLDCSLVYPVTRTIPYTQQVATASINELLKGVTSEESKNGFLSVMPEGTKLNSIKIENETAYVDFNENIGNGFTSCSGAIRLNAVAKTLKEFPTIKKVEFSVNGDKDSEALQP